MPDGASARMVEAFQELLPAVTLLVSHHFRRVLLEVAEEHIEAPDEAPSDEAPSDEAPSDPRRHSMTPAPGTRPSLPQGEEKARTVRRLFDTISPRYDLVNRVMTFGMDAGWRRRTVRELALPPGSRVFDLACGTGDLCRELAAAGHRPVGFDFSHGMLLAARTDAPLVEADILRLPVRDASADGATCGFALRNVVSLADLFAELARVRATGRPDRRCSRRPNRKVG